jgi:hypothetical protein
VSVKRKKGGKGDYPAAFFVINCDPSLPYGVVNSSELNRQKNK